MRRPQQHYSSVFLFLLLTGILLSLSSLARLLYRDYGLRASLAQFSLIAKGSQAAPLSGAEIDALRALDVEAGSYQMLAEGGSRDGQYLHTSSLLLDAELVRLLSAAAGDASLSTGLFRPLAQDDAIWISPRFAQRAAAGGGAILEKGASLRVGAKTYSVAAVLSQQQSSVLHLLGLDADLYRMLDRSSWNKPRLRPYFAISRNATAARRDAALRQVLAASRAGEQSNEIQFAPLLEITLGAWRRAVVSILCCCAVLALLMCCSIWTAFRNRRLSMRRELWTRMMLGASRRSLIVLGFRELMISAAAGWLFAGVAVLALLAAGFNWLELAGFSQDPGETLRSWLWIGLPLMLLASLVSTLGGLADLSLAEELTEAPSMQAVNASRRILVACSAAVSTVLAIFSLASFWNLAHTHAQRFIGDPGQLVGVSVFFPITDDYRGPRDFQRDMQAHFETARRLLAPLSANGEVAAGYSSAIQQSAGRVRVAPSWALDAELPVRRILVSPGYFRMLGLPLRWGQECPADAAGDPVTAPVLINSALLRMTGGTAGEALAAAVIREVSDQSLHPVIGLVADRGDAAAALPMIFACDFANAWEFYWRPQTGAEPARIVGSALALLRQQWPGADLDGRVVRDEMDGVLGPAQTQARVSAIFAFVTLLASVVTLGVVAVQVAQSQRRACAIREALGASTVRILWPVVQPVLRAVAIAVAIVAVAVALQAEFTGVFREASLPITPGIVSAAMGIVLAALLIPVVLCASWTLERDIAKVLRTD